MRHRNQYGDGILKINVEIPGAMSEEYSGLAPSSYIYQRTELTGKDLDKGSACSLSNFTQVRACFRKDLAAIVHNCE